MKYCFLLLCFTWLCVSGYGQKKSIVKKRPTDTLAVPVSDTTGYFLPLKWRNIGPFRGGRSVTSTGVPGKPLVYYMGTTGGGVWKTDNGGGNWFNISDGYFKTGSVGAVAVAEDDPNVVFVGMGEHAPRAVMSSYGDGVYKSTDEGKTWKHVGLKGTQSISHIRIHPTNADIIYVAAQGALYGPGKDRGVYKSSDGGVTWKNTLYVNENTGCADLSMDMNNPRILYAAMWDYQRKPWEMRSGGPESGLYKSTDGGETWERLQKGLPKEMGKMSIDVSRANSNRVYALIESDTQKEQGGLFVSNDAGESWSRISKDHRLVQRAWYYTEVFADPQNEDIVYVLNSPGLKSTDGGKSWTNIRGTHGDYHQLWINPTNNKNIVISNDGGGAVTYDGGKIWSQQNNQPTAQFYRVNADNLFPYNIYAGQQDNSSVMIASRNPNGYSIGEKNWTYSAGGESAFLAFNPDDPTLVMGGSYQGTIELAVRTTGESKPVMIAPIQYQSLQPKDMKYRFNWNAPIICSKFEPNTFYHGGNMVFKTSDLGKTWQVISPDLTTHDTSKMGMSGIPYTNEGAGGENYCTIAYILESPLEAGVIWTGSDDGVVSLTRDGGKTWKNVTPKGLGETLVNSIEVSPFDKATAYIATTKYKFNDYQPGLYKTTDYGNTWTKIDKGIPNGAYTRCIREDDKRKGLLYAGTETGFYVSFNDGADWKQLQLNLPVTPITDLKVHQGDLIASTSGRSFWILDDLNPLRSYDEKTDANKLVLYAPEDSYRTSGFSILDVNTAPEEDEGPTASTTGTNPTSGVPIYFQLPQNWKKSDSVDIEIFDSKGTLVRHYSQKKDPDFVSFPGGPPADPIISARPGLNRFVWDMRYPTMPGVPTVFIEGSYEGRKAAPGKYSAKLKVGKEEKTVDFNIIPDPRIQASNADYAAQQDLSTKIEADIKDIHETVLRTRKVRGQLNNTVDMLKGKQGIDTISASAKTIIDKLQRWEDSTVQNKAQSNDDIINFVNMISADYIFLKGQIDVNIPYVTEGLTVQYEKLNSDWKKMKATVDKIVQTDVATFNKLCSEKNISRIIIP
jgi:photosystem II stability/assembly factor-like uncharacterized protein